MNRYLQKLVSFALMMTSTLTLAAPPLQSNPPNEPGAIISAMLARDFRGLWRYTGWNEIEYTPLFESFPFYNVKRVKQADGKFSEIEEPPTFGQCSQKLLVKDIKVKMVEAAPDPTSPGGQPKAPPREVLVLVEAEVLAIELEKLNAIPELERCSWLGLEVRNTKTNKLESYFDNAEDDQALLKMMKQFGTLKGNYVVVEPHRRHWEYAVSMRLPFTGKGELRHYVKTTERQRGQGPFMDAVEPRWLIQDPYPPVAVHIKAAIQEELRKHDVVKMSAKTACAWAIAKNSSLDVGKVKENLEGPICKNDKEVKNSLSSVSRSAAKLQILRSIEQEHTP